MQPPIIQVGPRQQIDPEVVSPWTRTPQPQMTDPRQTESPLAFRIDDSVPVYRWHVLHAYDTAAECEKARSQGPLLWNRDERPKLKGLAPQHMWRCVPAEHIYPPAK